MRKYAMCLAGLMIAAVCCGRAYGNGYKILGVKSAKATAMGEAFIVRADDPSAIAFNPAGIAALGGNQVNLHATVCNGYSEHTSPSGVKTDNRDKWQVVPSMFATAETGWKDVVVGIGVSFPNGLSSEWAEDGFARYVTTYSSMILADISPAVGIRVGDGLKIGAGLNLYYSSMELKSMADLGLAAGMPGMMDAGRKMEGDGVSCGGNIGFIYDFNERNSAAAVFRLPFTVDYDGEMTLAGASSDIEASLDFPPVIVVGYACRPSDRLKVEVNLDWTGWNSVDDTVIETAFPGLERVPYQWGLDNTMAYKLGGEYAYSEKLALRCGYIYNENATSEATWRPSLPDTDTHFFSAGFGHREGAMTIDAALLVIYYETRTINNNVDMNEVLTSSSVDGTYRTWAPSVSAAVTYKF